MFCSKVLKEAAQTQGGGSVRHPGRSSGLFQQRQQRHLTGWPITSEHTLAVVISVEPAGEREGHHTVRLWMQTSNDFSFLSRCYQPLTPPEVLLCDRRESQEVVEDKKFHQVEVWTGGPLVACLKDQYRLGSVCGEAHNPQKKLP